MAKILLLDDDANALNGMRRLLMASHHDFDIEPFERAEAALARGAEVEFDTVVADFRMPEMDGVSFLERFRALQPETYRIVLSGYPDISMFRNAINRAQIHRFIEKPADGYVLEAAVLEGVEHTALRRDVRHMRAQLAAQQALLEEVETANPEALPADWREQVGAAT